MLIEFFNYLRQAFCTHKFSYEERRYEKFEYVLGQKRTTSVTLLVFQRCDKCGWHTSYRKYRKPG